MGNNTSKNTAAYAVKTIYSKTSIDTKKEILLGSIEGLSDILTNETILANKITSSVMNIDITIGDFIFALGQFCLSCKNVVQWQEFVMYLFTFVKDIYGNTYLLSFNKFLKKIGSLFCSLFIGSKIKTQSGNIKPIDTVYSVFRDNIGKMRKVFMNWQTICDTEFGQKMSVFIATVCTLPISEKYNIATDWLGFDHLQVQALKRQRVRQHRVTWIMQSLDCSLFIIERLAECIYHKNFDYIYISDEEIHTYKETFCEVAHRGANLDSIANRETRFKLRDFLTDVECLTEQAQHFKTVYTSKHPLFSVLTNNIQQLKLIKLKVLDKMSVRQDRDAPIAIVINGAPGIGKSQLIDKILRMIYDIAQVMEINGEPVSDKPYDPELKYTHSYSDKFESGFTCKHEVMIVDDAGQFKPSIIEAQQGGAMTHVIDWINSIPCITDQAELANKGMIPFLCKYVIITTNFEDAGLKHVFNASGGAWRRLLFLDTQVKEQYRKPGTNMLQGDLDNIHNYDLHQFSPRKYVPSGDHNTALRWSFADHSWSASGSAEYSNLEDLAYFLKDEIMYPHYSSIHRAKQTLNSFNKSQPCKYCGVSTYFCNEKCPSRSAKLQAGSDDEISIATSSEDDGNFTFRDDYLSDLEYDERKSFGDYIHHFYLNVCLWCSFVPLLLSHFTRSDTSVSKVQNKRNYIKLRLLSYKGKITNNSIFFDPTEIIKQHRNDIMASLGLTILMTLSLSYGLSAFFSTTEEKEDETEEFDLQVGEVAHAAKKDAWKIDFQDISKLTGKPSTTTYEQLKITARRNIVAIRYLSSNGKKAMTNAFGTHSNVAVVPRHFYDEIRDQLPLKVDLIRTDKMSICGPSRYNVIIDESNFLFSQKQGDDCIRIRAPEFGTFRDLRPYFFQGFESGKVCGTMIARDYSGEIYENNFKGLTKADIKYTSPLSIPFHYTGYNAYTDEPTKTGSCGGVYIVNSIYGSYLVGFHVAYCSYRGLHKTYINPLRDIGYINDFIEPNSFDGIDLNETMVTTQDLTITQSFHSKCPLQDLEEGSLLPYGRLNLSRPKMRTQVCDTLMITDVLEYFKMLEPTHTSPKGISARISTVKNVEKMVVKTVIPPSMLEKAKISLISVYKRAIHKNKIILPDKIYDISVGINGLDDVPYVSRLACKTSGGFGHRGRKDRYFEILESNDIHDTHYGLNEELQQEYENILLLFRQNKRPGIIWDFCHKDEPVTWAKVEKQKGRIFNSAPLCFSILERQCFLWFIPLMSGSFRHQFGSAIGADSSGQDWTTLYKVITKFGTDRIIAGDYSGFDKTMSSATMLAAFEVIIAIAKEAGFSSSDIQLMKSVATECSYPTSNVFGSVVEFYGCNPSGHPLTTIINCIVNILYIMIACMKIETELDEHEIEYDNFFNYVSLLTYGDDNIMSSRLDYINHTSLSKALKTFGLGYTMADKESESVPFINISDADFLKRKFIVGNNREDAVSSPLDEESIIKSLTKCNRSKTIEFDHQCSEIIGSACREYFQYGPEIFKERRKFLNKLLDKYNLRPYLSYCQLPTYDELFAARFEICTQSGNLFGLIEL